LPNKKKPAVPFNRMEKKKSYKIQKRQRTTDKQGAPAGVIERANEKWETRQLKRKLKELVKYTWELSKA